MRHPDVQQAIDRAGGVRRLARALGISPSTVTGWRNLPAKYVKAVSDLTGLPPEHLRSDMFGAKKQQGFAETQAPFATEARALGLDPDAIAAQAIADAIRAEKARRWQAENRAAMEAWNDWTEQNGLPLAKYRMF